MPMLRRIAVPALALATVLGFGVRAASARGIVCSPGYCGRLYVVAIGYDGGLESGVFIRSAESDAERFARRLVMEPSGPEPRPQALSDLTREQLAALSQPSPTSNARLARARAAFHADSISGPRVAILTGDSATRDMVQAALARVAAVARPQDALVVFYGGMSYRIAGPDSIAQQYLQLAGRRIADDSTMLRYGVSATELGSWLSGIGIESQLLVVEAGSGQEFLEDFSLGIIERDESARRLLKRHRVVLAPSTFGVERAEGGELTSAVVGARQPLRSIWASPIRTLAAIEDAAPRPGQVAFFEERPLLNIARALAARAASASRGAQGVAPEAPRPAPALGRHVALLIGTDVYAEGSGWSPLRNPIRDVSVIARELAEGFGFDTVVLRNPTRRQLLETLVALSERKFGDKDQLLVFAAGHGHYDPRLRMGYLVTTDSRPLAEDRIRESYVSHGQIAQYLDPLPVRHVLTVLDACFGGAFADLPGGGQRGEAEYNDLNVADFVNQRLGPQSRLYLTSGGTEYVPDGRPGMHSPFAYRFIATLRNAKAGTRPLTISGLRAGVESAQPGPRTGEFGSSEPGADFLFIPRSLQSRP